ncbi:uncharacterized protein [Canis lupus baileyi]|uniref:uncharacterized protein n=1 Tax=Canis lupus baileyi TaxID=143281 RepID=UPI003B9711DD
MVSASRSARLSRCRPASPVELPAPRARPWAARRRSLLDTPPPGPRRLGAVARAGGDSGRLLPPRPRLPPRSPPPPRLAPDSVLCLSWNPSSFLFTSGGSRASTPAPKALRAPESGPRVPQEGRASVRPHTLAGLRPAARAGGPWSACIRSSQTPTRKVRAHGGAWGPARPGLSGGAGIGACAPRRGGQIPEGLGGLGGGGVINYSALGLKPAAPAAVGVDVLRILFAHSNRRDFSAVCASRIRINAARRHPAGNGSRFECMQTHRPSAGREVAPGDLAAAGPASKGDWAVSALRPGAAPCCPAVPGSPHPWGGGVCFGNPPGGVRPRQKLKANAEAKEARTFFDATLPQRSGGDLGRTARWCVRARKVGAPAEGGLGRPSLARGETLGKAPPLPYFSPTPRPPSVKK